MIFQKAILVGCRSWHQFGNRTTNSPPGWPADVEERLLAITDPPYWLSEFTANGIWAGTKRIRQKVLKNISSFFSDTKDIKLCVYESMSDYGTNPDLKGWIAADEVQEPKALQEEINKIREENRALTEQIDRLRTAANVRVATPSTAQDQELLEVLQAIETKNSC